MMDRGIAESLADFKEGRTYGPFETHEELVKSLHDQQEYHLHDMKPHPK